MSNRLLVANNRFFHSGGPERYMFNLLPHLLEAGFEAIPFALKSNRNLPSPFSDYFADHPMGDDYTFFGDRELSITEKMKLAWKVTYDSKVRRQAVKAIKENECNAVYALQIAHYLYPEVVLAANDCGVPVVMRMSDFQLACPAYSMFRDGSPCDKCKTGLWHGLFHRCMKDSALITGARITAMYVHNFMGIKKKVAAFVCPSKFMYRQLREAGLPADKLEHIPTPINPAFESSNPKPYDPDGPVLFVGGLYEAKGAHVAVDAAINHGFDLVVAGQTDTPIGADLIEKVKSEKATNISFAGFVTGEKLEALYDSASCVVVPSLWYENTPNVVIESYARGRPVVASDIGSLPELVVHEQTGLLFKPGDSDELAKMVGVIKSDSKAAGGFAKKGCELIWAEHSMSEHLAGLRSLFRRVM